MHLALEAIIMTKRDNKVYAVYRELILLYCPKFLNYFINGQFFLRYTAPNQSRHEKWLTEYVLPYLYSCEVTEAKIS